MNAARLITRRFTFSPLLILVIITMFLSACSQQEKNAVNESAEGNRDTVNLTQEHATMTAQTNSPIAIINRPHYHTIEIKQMKFNPQELTVEKGDTVVWVNNGITAHDVTEQPDGKWTSASMPVGTSWQMVVDETSDYYCSIHVVMKGKLMVK